MADGLGWGFGTVLLPFGDDRVAVGANDERTLALFVAAAGKPAPPAALLVLKTARADWARGDKALASIRLAFAPVRRLDEESAYRLFLAEQALDAGLGATPTLRALGLTDVAACLKYDPNQPRVPAGSGRESGRFAGQTEGAVPPANSGSTSTSGARALVRPVFFDEREAERGHLLPDLDGSRPNHPNLADKPFPQLLPDVGGLPLFVPLPSPAPTMTDDGDKDGPACPDMRPDRPSSNNAAGQWEEFRLSLSVNPSSPTPKRTPVSPDVTSMAYYFPTGDGDQEVAIDDCKRTTEPSPIPGIRKGDVVEGKTEGSAGLALKEFPGNQAAIQYDRQFKSQYNALELEGKGRWLFQCVGSAANADALRDLYKFDDYPNARFLVCP